MAVADKFEITAPEGTRALVKALLAAVPQDIPESQLWLLGPVSLAKQLIALPSVEPEVRALLEKRLSAVTAQAPSPLTLSIATAVDKQPSVPALVHAVPAPRVGGGRQELYLQFWTELLSAVNQAQGNLLSFRQAPKENWLEVPTGRGGFVLTWAFGHGGKFRSELYIDVGDKTTNEAYFARLEKQRKSIEAALGPLSWERLERRKGCRIAAVREGSVENQDSWPELREWAIDRHMAFRQVFLPRILGRDLDE